MHNGSITSSRDDRWLRNCPHSRSNFLHGGCNCLHSECRNYLHTNCNYLHCGRRNCLCSGCNRLHVGYNYPHVCATVCAAALTAYIVTPRPGKVYAEIWCLNLLPFKVSLLLNWIIYYLTIALLDWKNFSDYLEIFSFAESLSSYAPNPRS